MSNNLKDTLPPTSYATVLRVLEQGRARAINQELHDALAECRKASEEVQQALAEIRQLVSRTITSDYTTEVSGEIGGAK